MRCVLTNGMWRELEPRLGAARKSPCGAKPALPDRLFLEAVLYRARTGLPWRDLPAAFGHRNAVFQRAKRWRESGVWDRLFDGLARGHPLSGARHLFVDSTTVRAHAHAAGAEQKTRPTTKPSGVPAADTRPKATSPPPTRTAPPRCG